MSKPKVPDADFIDWVKQYGVAEAARRAGTTQRNAFARRARLEDRLGYQITGPEHHSRTRNHISHPKRIELSIPNGVVLVGSDGHYWPEEKSPAHRAFVKFAKDMKPRAVIQNGDVFDGASISRHPPIGWTHQPTVEEEIECCQDRLHEIVEASPRGCKKIWTLGNHDSRFETRIATVAPEFAKVHGTSLKDHFSLWDPCWSVFINDEVVVKHRFKSGMHAAQNNALWAGKTIVTGHLHRSRVVTISDYNGPRYGVETGCLANTDADAFDYLEDNPVNWQQGIAVLTFKNSELLMPELVTAWDENHVQFRGEIIRV